MRPSGSESVALDQQQVRRRALARLRPHSQMLHARSVASAPVAPYLITPLPGSATS
jgi:hypothetical protein